MIHKTPEDESEHLPPDDEEEEEEELPGSPEPNEGVKSTATSCDAVVAAAESQAAA